MAQKGRHGSPKTIRRVRALVILVVAFSAIIAGAQMTKNQPAAQSRAPNRVVHLGVGLASCTFIDQTRPTENFATATSTAGRRLITEIRYPTTAVTPGLSETRDAAPYRKGGPYPLVVFAHGYSITPDAYSKLLDTWVKAGMVVIAPLFPDTTPAAILAQGNDDTETDIINQPADLAFVIHQVVTATSNGYGCNVVKHLINSRKIGLAGQSDGGETVDALAFENVYLAAGLHYSAVESLSGSLMPPPTNTTKVTETGHAPLLVVQSATDQCNPPPESLALYNSVSESDKWFLTIKKGDHLPPYTGQAFIADFHLVAAETTQFFRSEFAGQQPMAKMTKIATAAGTVGSVSTGPAPVLPALAFARSACYLN